MTDNNISAFLPRPAARRAGLAVNVALSLLACALLAACDPVPKDKPSVVQSTVQSPILSSQTETLTPDELRRVSDNFAGQSYVLGPDDVISTYVYLHPELDVPISTSGTNGALITSDGTVGLPLIGNIHIGGLTLQQAQQRLTDAYATYVNTPKVTIMLVSAQSLRYYLLGAFTDPGIKFPVHSLTLLEALALGGSVDLPNADLYQAYVAQGNVKLPVDLRALLVDGDLSQNIPLAPGDAVVIPSSATENAYLLGAVKSPGAVRFVSGQLSLLAALSEAGMDLSSYTDARLSRIHIIRSHGRSAEFLVVDAMAIMNGKASSFNLVPGDIVFVPPTAVATWNQVLGEIIPSLTVISDALNPFVSIKYLQKN